MNKLTITDLDHLKDIVHKEIFEIYHILLNNMVGAEDKAYLEQQMRINQMILSKISKMINADKNDN